MAYVDYKIILKKYNWVGKGENNYTQELPTTYLTPNNDGDYSISYNFVLDRNSLLLASYYQTSDNEYLEFRTQTQLQKKITNIILHKDSGYDYSYSVFFSDVANIEFVSAAPQNADLLIGQRDGVTFPDNFVGAESLGFDPDPNSSGYQPIEKRYGDIWFNEDWVAWDSGQEGAADFWNVLHEFGHSLGLRHTNPINNPKSILAFDNQKNSIMSYNVLFGMNHNLIAERAYASGLQLFDIAAIQEIYGRNFGTRDEDGTTYSKETAFTSTRLNDAFIYTIWDGGGVGDTISAVGFYENGLGAGGISGATIDLRQGEFSSIGSSVTAAKAIDNVAIAFHAIIENAVGSIKGDILIGNAWDNKLEGGDGDDELYGDGVVYDGNAGFGANDGNHDEDPLNLSVRAHFNNSGNDELYGGAGNDVIYGGAGNDRLFGGEDNDTIVSGEGEDIIDGGAGNDTIRVTGGLYNVLRGGDDNDEYIIEFGARADIVYDPNATGTDTVSLQGYTLSNLYFKRDGDDLVVENNVYPDADNAFLLLEVLRIEGHFLGAPSTAQVSTLQFLDEEGVPIDDATIDLVTLKEIITADLGSGFSVVQLKTANDDTPDLSGNTNSPDLYWSGSILLGDEGANTLTMFPLDSLSTGLGNSIIYGGVGDDTIIVNAQSSHAYYVNGGKGTDTFIHASGTDLIVEDELVRTNSGIVEDIEIIEFSESAAGNVYSGMVVYSRALGMVYNLKNSSNAPSFDYSEINKSLHFNIGATSWNVSGGGKTDSFTNVGSISNAKFYATNNNDVIDVNDGSGVVWLGGGNDTVNVTSGQVTVVYSEGNDLINQPDNTSIQFAKTITQSDLSYGDKNVSLVYSDSYYRIYQYDLFVTVNGHGSITIKDRFYTISSGADNKFGTSDDYEQRTMPAFRFLFGQDETYEQSNILSAYYSISAHGGDDTIYGSAGYNSLGGGFGADTIYGYAGDDYLGGGHGSDNIWGGDGNDSIDGGAGDDVLYGNSGNDYILGSGGDDFIYGNDGDDEIHAGFGNDYIEGNDGNDYIGAIGGFNEIHGGLGDDRLYAGGVLFGDDGNDILGSSSIGSLLYGGNGDDRLYGHDGDDTLYGDDGDDILEGFEGHDTLYGGMGDDQIYTYGGNDTVFGGEGNDYVGVGGGAEYFDGGAGVDIISYYNSPGGITINLETNTVSGSWASDDTVMNFEIFYGSKFGNNHVTGTSGANEIVTHFGDDKVYAGDGDDRVYAGEGNDEVYLGSGDDYVRVGGGAEYFDGGSGTDVISYYDSPDGVTVNLETNSTSGSWAEDDTIIDFESLYGSETGGDHITGTFGANRILTHGGDDKVYAGGGDDEVYLGDGDDIVDGGAGNDDLFGGAGDDTFIYNLSENVGSLDNFYAGLGFDTFAIYLTNAEYLTYQDELGLYRSYLDTYSDPTSESLSVTTSTGVVLSDFEKLDVYVDGILQASENDDPVAKDDNFTTAEENFISGNVFADNGNGADSDVDANDLLFVKAVNGNSNNIGIQITLASGALLLLNADGTFAYDPNGQFESLGVGESTTDNFSYTLDDGNGGTDDAQAVVTINGVNDAPIQTENTGLQIDEGATGVIISTSVLLATDLDNSAEELSYTITNAPDEGTVLLDGNALGIGDTFTQANINDGLVLYDHSGSEIANDSFDFVLSDGTEVLDEQTFAVTVNLSLDGGTDRDVLSGDIGDDTITGGGGADILHGNTGNDVLIGDDLQSSQSGGRDYLYGGEGDDRLIGGAGFDVLSGGAGADTFVFTHTDSMDMISDFNASEGDILEIEIASMLDSSGAVDASRLQAMDVGPYTMLKADFDDTGTYTNLALIKGTGLEVFDLFDFI